MEAPALRPVATELRKHILRMIQAAQSGHPGASLSSADLVTVLYYDEMRVRPEDPAWIFWTSGTTGHPKGAVLAHDCIVNVWNWTTLAAGVARGVARKRNHV